MSSETDLPEKPNNPEPEVSEKFKETTEAVVDSIIMNLEFGLHLETPVGLDPHMWSEEEDPRTFSELEPEEKRYLMEKLGFDVEGSEVANSYSTELDGQPANVNVFQIEVEINDEPEEAFLHHQTTQDGAEDYFIYGSPDNPN